jgi:hypothetical protein
MQLFEHIIYLRKKRKWVAILITALLVTATVLLVAFRSNNDLIELPSTKVTLAKSPKQSIYIYGDSLRKSDGIYNGLYLSINGVVKYYDWVSMSNSFPPEIVLKDLNSDRKDELVIILTKSEGTGVQDSAVHVINPENFNESEVINPLSIINEFIDSSIVQSNGIVTITVVVSGQKSIITLKEGFSKGWFKEKAAFGNIVRYKVDSSKLIATVPMQVAIAGFIGDVSITYVFKDNKYVSERIEFVPYKNLY